MSEILVQMSSINRVLYIFSSQYVSEKNIGQVYQNNKFLLEII